ncbi:hypothetical protein [Streptomyces rhizosphaericus]|uniref:hypothetical protein n=1 Tax=Streptomyces rhizosphaericus TaxID=114699 RepID=UPI0020306ACB|nr:hypothetical protein [Streptomyces rhizosphaericus]
MFGQAGTATKALDERKTTLGEYLERRHAWRESGVKTGGLKKTTVDSDREAIGLYLKPGLGHFKVADLRDQPIRDLCGRLSGSSGGNRPAMSRPRSCARGVDHAAPTDPLP